MEEDVSALPTTEASELANARLQHQFHAAIAERVKRCRERRRVTEGSTGALLDAIFAGDVEAAARALDEGANANYRGKDDDCDDLPLVVAVTTGEASIVDLLLRRGADFQQCRPGLSLIDQAVIHCPASIPHLVRVGARVDDENEMGFTPLGIATTILSTEAIRHLGAAGVDANRGLSNLEVTPLSFALYVPFGRGADAIRALCAIGADPERPLMTTRPDAPTPLMTAAASGTMLRNMEALLDGGADVNRTVNGLSALFHAAYAENIDTTKSLLRRGARHDLDAIRAIIRQRCLRCQVGLETSVVEPYLASVVAAGGWRTFVSEPRLKMLLLRALVADGRASVAPGPGVYARLFATRRLQGSAVSARTRARRATSTTVLPDAIFWTILEFWWGG